MMSKKTFSLTILITLLALAFIVPSALAGVLGENFSTTISLAGTPAGDNVIATGGISVNVVFGKETTLIQDESDPVTALETAAFTSDDVSALGYNKMTGAAVAITVGTLARNPTTVTTDPWAMYTVPLGTIAADTVVVVTIAKGKVTNANPADVIAAATGDDTLGMNDKGSLRFDVVAKPPAEPTNPRVTSVMGLPPIVLSPDADPAFTFTVTLSEKPKEFKKDHIEASNATVSGDPVFAGTETEAEANISTEVSNLLYKYLVTIAPKYESKDDIVIKIKSFEDTSTPANKSLVSMAYMVKVNSDANKKVALSGAEINLTNKAVVPADGSLVVAKDKGMSLVIDPGNAEHGAADRARRDRAFKQSYNLVAVDLGVNLEGFLIRGGTIDLVSPNAGLAISEIMWATDGGSRDRQWIEISNMTSADIKFGDKTHKLMLYESSETLPDMTDAANKIVDRVSTLYKGANYWSIAGKGQSGRIDPIVKEEVAGADDDVDVDIEVVDTAKLVSMQRAMEADGTYADGTMEDAWSMSVPPARNFADGAQGLVVGTPGTMPITPVTVEIPETEAAVDAAMASDIMITEIMVDTNSGRLPQWIELTHVGTGEVSLDGWEMVIDNAIDADVLGGGNAITVSLSGVTLDVSTNASNMGKGQSVLVVAWAGRSSANINAARVLNIATQLNQTRRYQLLSYNGFRITLVPPQTGAIAAFGDIAGNLDEEWEIEMSEGSARSSLIRREMAGTPAAATMGTDANGWVLASGTALSKGPQSYYGSDEDEGTPGYDSGGPLPVELSHFRPARDKQTGAVVITWSTQSELNNAGFFIKRAQQKDGEFKIINAAMVAGAGTTSERQFYTYTDTTAQPNVVYYYQIEDVSLDGNRQTLTNGIRLKGHIGAAGKLTSTWGELKTSNE